MEAGSPERRLKGWEAEAWGGVKMGKVKEGRSENPVIPLGTPGAVSELGYSAALPFFRKDWHSKLAIL